MRTGQGNWRDCAQRRVDGFTLVVANCSAVNCREWVHFDHECCSSRSGGPQCFGGKWDDVQYGV